MPKLKTNKAVRKRFRVTKNGKVLYTKSKKRHLLGHKSAKQKRKLKSRSVASEHNAEKIIRALPY
ncbi:MAG: 50S ribosomal protein L35 [Candidatus Omnitrophica bacterium CG11_big_fil_rev_8_21_14_0_20_45_26]|uniref:Large ribosomal subunit protein bL35 n=1 Tax=Candidatus Abzuiibacterium crystallinum TaxID=1974748 RepID=A0A2H0LS82_9BACT|nr:MAG: 50S ribosomal protein L35 [Candidatus Omnitrophica bacterium CG11_big_fil_rev_8_21_14_0_20_45_26]PIW64960.1 MAG: 50S ribosomal protein L35 [Candidatus Omnitrophica bacterium CG12_big_fil_rev_8_21_14_0_65_45_16]